MTHHLSAHSTRAAGAKLAIAVIAGALAVPAVAGAQPIPADPSSSYPGKPDAIVQGSADPGTPAPGISDFASGNGQATQRSSGGSDVAFTGSVTALSHETAPADTTVAVGNSGNDQAFTGSVTALSHETAPADTTVALRRDGSKADPFVASIGGTPSSASGDDFAWGDAAIGAGAALGLVALAGGAGMALRRRGIYPPQSVPTGS
jgi:hypothetical protein